MRGSLVGVSFCLAIVHQPPSFCDEDGEGGVAGMVCEREGGGRRDSGLFCSIAITRSSTVRLSSASFARISSASRLLCSRSLSASASSSSSVGSPGDFELMLLISDPTRCAKLAANWVTDGEGERGRWPH